MAKPPAKKAVKAKNPTGRPPTFTEKDKERIIAHVLGELSSGIPISRTLGANREPWLCTERHWWNWYYEASAEDVDGLVQKVSRARACGVEAQMDRAAYIAETPMMGEIITIERDPEHQKDAEDGAEITKLDGAPYEGMTVKIRREDMLGHRKLLVDTLIKQAQMLKPKTYGPKLDLTTQGEKIGLSDMIAEGRKRAEKGMGGE
jgi:hypothetical protein